MHEVGLTTELVQALDAKAGDAKVVRVVLEIGKLSAVLPDAIRFCFDSIAVGTKLEGATLVIEEIDGRGTCRVCGTTFALAKAYDACPDCGTNAYVDVVAGNEMRVREMQVAEVRSCA